MDRQLSDYQKRLDEKLFKRELNDSIRFRVKEALCVYKESQRDYTLNLMRNISSYAVKVGMRVIIDLEKCPSISAAALVIFFAEISRAKIATRFNKIITVHFGRNGSLESLLTSVGWVKAISADHDKYGALISEQCVFQTLSHPGEAMLSIYNLLLNSGVELTRPESKIFTKGINEAILNVIHHAYSNESDPLGGIGRRWWQACWRQEGTNSLVYIIFDLGQGITCSLPRCNETETVEQHIERAMQQGVTCTGDPNRGKGSENIKDAADIREKSSLFIGSRNALYTKRSFEKPIAREIWLPFNGTIAEWQINLEE